MEKLVLTGFKLFDQFPVAESDGAGGYSAEEMRFLERIVPGEEITLRCGIGILPRRQRGNAIKDLIGIGQDTRRCQQGRVEIGVDGWCVRDLSSLDASGPPDDQRHPNTSLIELALASAQRGIGSHVRLTTVIAGKDHDGRSTRARSV